MTIVVVRGSFFVGSNGDVLECQSHTPVATSDVNATGLDLVVRESDLVPIKPRGELVFVNPCAQRADSRPMKYFDVSIKCGVRETRLVATGPRVLERKLTQLTLSEPTPAERVPLDYMRSVGGGDHERGFDERNPVGVGYSVIAGHESECAAPQVWWRDELDAGMDTSQMTPAGCTAVGRSWLPRRKLAGTYDEQWLKKRWPLWAEDARPEFFQSVAEQLQFDPELLLSDISITGMSGGELFFALGSGFKLTLTDAGSIATILPDTLYIDTGQRRVDVVWRTRLSHEAINRIKLFQPVYYSEARL